MSFLVTMKAWLPFAEPLGKAEMRVWHWRSSLSATCKNVKQKLSCCGTTNLPITAMCAEIRINMLVLLQTNCPHLLAENPLVAHAGARRNRFAYSTSDAALAADEWLLDCCCSAHLQGSEKHANGRSQVTTGVSDNGTTYTCYPLLTSRGACRGQRKRQRARQRGPPACQKAR